MNPPTPRVALSLTDDQLEEFARLAAILRMPMSRAIAWFLATRHEELLTTIARLEEAVQT
jgi:hypothetical protein